MSKKTVSIALEDEDYDALKQLAKDEDRDVSGQARHMLRRLLKAHADGRVIEVTLAPETVLPNDTTQPENRTGWQPAAHQNPTEATSKTLPG